MLEWKNTTCDTKISIRYVNCDYLLFYDNNIKGLQLGLNLGVQNDFILIMLQFIFLQILQQVCIKICL